MAYSNKIRKAIEGTCGKAGLVLVDITVGGVHPKVTVRDEASGVQWTTPMAKVSGCDPRAMLNKVSQLKQELRRLKDLKGVKDD